VDTAINSIQLMLKSSEMNGGYNEIPTLFKSGLAKNLNKNENNEKSN